VCSFFFDKKGDFFDLSLLRFLSDIPYDHQFGNEFKIDREIRAPNGLQLAVF
jgi:hypothetical protein